MAGVDLTCDTPECPNPASGFGFSRNGNKTKYCELHATKEADNLIASFSLEPYQYMETIGDYKSYTERKTRMEKGKECLIRLENLYKEEFIRSQNRLHEMPRSLCTAVVLAYEQIWRQEQQSYANFQLHLTAAEHQLSRLVTEKLFEISPEVSAMCESESVKSPYRLVVGDCRDEVINAVRRYSCRLTCEDTEEGLNGLIGKLGELGRMDAVNEIAIYSRELGYREVDYQDQAREMLARIEQQVLEISEQDIPTLAFTHLTAGKVAIQQGAYAAAIKELEKGKELMRQWGMGTSELSLEIRNTIAEAYHQEARFDKCESECAEILKNCSRGLCTSQVLRAVFLLTDSLYCQKERERGCKIAQDWDLQTDDPIINCLNFYIQANRLEVQDYPVEASSLYEQGLQLGFTLLPDSYLTALCSVYLGHLYKSRSSEYITNAHTCYQQALTIFSSLCPLSTSYCWCLYKSAHIYYLSRQYDSAEQFLTYSYNTLKSRFPDSRYLGVCLHRLGQVYEATDRKEYAVRAQEEAKPILSRYESSLTLKCEETIQRLRR